MKNYMTFSEQSDAFSIEQHRTLAKYVVDSDLILANVIILEIQTRLITLSQQKPKTLNRIPVPAEQFKPSISDEVKSDLNIILGDLQKMEEQLSHILSSPRVKELKKPIP